MNTAFNQLEETNIRGLESYTLSFDKSSLAYGLTLTLTWDENGYRPNIYPDQTFSVRTLGVNKTYYVTEHMMERFKVTVNMLSQEARIAKRAASKDLKYISMWQPNETYDWELYLEEMAAAGGSIDDLPYYPAVKYFYYSVLAGQDPYFKRYGGWTCHDILRSVANLMGLSVKTNIVNYFVREMCIPVGTSYYTAIAGLVSFFEPHIRIQGGTLYIIDRSSVGSWSGVLQITNAENATERQLYKEVTDKVVFFGGTGPLLASRLEGQVFLDKDVRYLERVLDEQKNVRFKVVCYGYKGEGYGSPPDEVTTNELTDERDIVYQKTKTTKKFVYDVYRSRKTVYYTQHEAWQLNRANLTDSPYGSLEQTENSEEFFRYSFLNAIYENPRLESPNPGNDYFPILTMDNWARFRRIGKKIWVWNELLEEFIWIIDPDTEWEFEWIFYKDNRMTYRVVRRYAIMYTRNILPTKYEDSAGLPWLPNSQVQWWQYNTIGLETNIDANVGTILPISMSYFGEAAAAQAPYYDGFADPRTLVESVEESYVPVTRRTFSFSSKRVYRNPQTGFEETQDTKQLLPVSDVPYSPVGPALTNIVSKDTYRSPIDFSLSRPPLVISNAHVTDYAEADKIRTVTKKRLINPEYQRTYTLPFGLYCEKGWLVRFSAITDFLGRSILPSRPIAGQIVNYSLTKGPQTAQTTIVTEALAQ